MKHKIAATVICKYSGIPLAISTLWPKLRLESKDVMIGQPFSIVASHAKAWRHYNISQKRVIIASLLYCTNLVKFFVPINPSETVSDVIISDLLSVVGEFVEVSQEKRYNFPKFNVERTNSNLTGIEIWIRTLKDAIKEYKTKNTKAIKLDDIARATVYNREFEKNFNISVVSKRSFVLCQPHLDGMLNAYQTRVLASSIALVGSTAKQIVKGLKADKIRTDTLKEIRDIIYSIVPENEASLIPHKILCLRWFDCVLDSYDDLLSSLVGEEFTVVTPQIINGVMLKTKVVISESGKPLPKDFKDFKEYVKALKEWNNSK